jgi:hypothetical protein
VAIIPMLVSKENAQRPIFVVGKNLLNETNNLGSSVRAWIT